MAMYAEQSRPLAMAAAEQALERAGLTGNAITHLVTVSCTGFDAPGVDIHLFDELGLPDTTQRVNVGFMGCHGGINGLRTARGLAAADPDAHLALCSGTLQLALQVSMGTRLHARKCAVRGRCGGSRGKSGVRRRWSDCVFATQRRAC